MIVLYIKWNTQVLHSYCLFMLTIFLATAYFILSCVRQFNKVISFFLTLCSFFITIIHKALLATVFIFSAHLGNIIDSLSSFPLISLLLSFFYFHVIHCQKCFAPTPTSFRCSATWFRSWTWEVSGAVEPQAWCGDALPARIFLSCDQNWHHEPLWYSWWPRRWSPTHKTQSHHGFCLGLGLRCHSWIPEWGWNKVLGVSQHVGAKGPGPWIAWEHLRGCGERLREPVDGPRSLPGAEILQSVGSRPSQVGQSHRFVQARFLGGHVASSFRSASI